MKRNRFIPTAGLAIATVLLVSASVWVFENRPTIWGHTEGMTQEEIMEKLHQLTIADFLKDFDQAMEDIQNGKGDPDLGVCWGQVCIERASEFSDDEIISRIYETMDDVYLRDVYKRQFHFFLLQLFVFIPSTSPLSKKQSIQDNEGKNIPHFQRNNTAGKNPNASYKDQAWNHTTPKGTFHLCTQEILSHHQYQRNSKTSNKF